MERERITAEILRAFSEAIRETVFFGGNHEVPKFTFTSGGHMEWDREERNPETTLSGAPKPQRIPYRLENIEEAQIETA